MIFASKSEGQKHMAIAHQGVKSFECSLCPVSFSRKSDLNKHKRRKHALVEGRGKYFSERVKIKSGHSFG